MTPVETPGVETPERQHLQAGIETIGRDITAGAVIPVDPDVADAMGAFAETALDPADADDSRFDVDPDTGIVIDETDDRETASGRIA